MRGRELDKIDQYLLGEMDAEELSDFEYQLKNDQDLKVSVDIRKAIHQELGEQYAKELKEKLISYDEQIDKKSWVSNSMKIAAGIVLVLIGVFSIYQFNNKPDLSFYDFYEEGINNYMNDEAEKVQFNNAMSKFRIEKYELASLEFEKLLEVKPANDTLNYYLGVCYFRNGEFAKSSELMNAVLLNSNSNYYQKAEFRLALSYYANHEKAKAKPIFTTIADSQTQEFSDEAKEILKSW